MIDAPVMPGRSVTRSRSPTGSSLSRADTDTSHVAPYASGCFMTASRLAATEMAAVTASTASAVPTSAVPIGSPVPPRPPLAARLTPTAADGGRPRLPTTAAWPLRRRGARASRHTGNQATRRMATASSGRPTTMTKRSIRTPGRTSAARARPTGLRAERASATIAAMATAPTAMGTPRVSAVAPICRVGHADGAQRRQVRPLPPYLARQSLSDEDQPGDRGDDGDGHRGTGFVVIRPLECGHVVACDVPAHAEQPTGEGRGDGTARRDGIIDEQEDRAIEHGRALDASLESGRRQDQLVTGGPGDLRAEIPERADDADDA